MKNILFLCTGNSCRSQMAEGWGKYFHGKNFNFFSAGIEKHGLNPRAIKVMQESGVDISHHYSKTIDDLKNVEFDLVITVCEDANEKCPSFFNAPKVIHIGFDDPPRISKGAKSEEEILSHYRRVRDEIRSYVQKLEMD